VNQEMVLRLGAVTGVGHARLILERFGKFWGAFSAIDLFLLNALTIVTEFIGISLGMDFLGVPKSSAWAWLRYSSCCRPVPATSAASSAFR
jgi:Mn2+/Fe2+ NRAMP family transporter